MSLKRAALLLLLGGAVIPAIAQQIELPVGNAPAADRTPTADGTARPGIDESALRYFASQGDTRRLEAEIARLRALYPDWSPPADLFGPQSDPDLERMWKLYAEGKLSDVRSAIAARQATDPSWQPPAELLARLDESENRRRLINASDAQQWSTVLRMATETPGLLTCANVDILWRVGEAFAKTNQMQRSLDAYTYLLTNCNDPAERLATIQKALPLLDDEQVKQLLALERKDAQGQPEFTTIRDELIRRRVGRAAENPEFIVSNDDIARLETLARAGNTPDDPLLLGWYLFRHDEASRALDWFKLALDRQGGAKAAEGYVLALNSLGRALEAEPIAFQWRDAAPQNGKAYLDVVISLLTAAPPPVLSETVLTRFSPVVMHDKYVPGAQALGWYAYNTGQLVVAQAWFQTALSWDPNDEPSSYGLALTYWRLNDAARLNALVQSWRGRSERIVALVDANLRAQLEARNLQGQINRTTDPLVAAALRVTPPPANTGAPAAGLAYGAGQPQTTGFQPVPSQFQPIPAQATGQATGQPFQPVPVQTTQVAPMQTAQPAPVRRAYAQSAGYQPAAANRSRTTSGGGTQGGGGAAALSRGWRLMELNRPIEAVTAFDEAIRTGSGRIAEEAAYGKSLAYMRKGMTNQAQVAATEAPQSPRRAMQLTADLLAQRAYDFYRDQRYVEAIISLDERARISPEQQDLMMMRGWSYFNIRDYQSAERIFRALAAQGNTDAMNGVSEIEFARRLYKRE
ncbi:tetratricopeptide (TPR) repeat protein [Ancylobacter sp. 3268]|uniref:DUF1720 domain-containing protein n=1 Tax=Ancylobacter sp. 3268 TaxID=2817752 RepID=UPI0028670B78|nr:DUF1720 domain-containing protein [Ancylobacter sp. 3268]MDR6955903.1 tetratricopeptide (TPR) repeat protein [Ancylobacter sp. 3268]